MSCWFKLCKERKWQSTVWVGDIKLFNCFHSFPHVVYCLFFLPKKCSGSLQCHISTRLQSIYAWFIQGGKQSSSLKITRYFHNIFFGNLSTIWPHRFHFIVRAHKKYYGLHFTKMSIACNISRVQKCSSTLFSENN